MSSLNWIEDTRKGIRLCSNDDSDKLADYVQFIEDRIAIEENSGSDIDLIRRIAYLAIPALRKLNTSTVQQSNPDELPSNTIDKLCNFDFHSSCRSSYKFDVEITGSKNHSFNYSGLSDSVLYNDFEVYRANVAKSEVFNPNGHVVYGLKNTLFPVSKLVRFNTGYGMVSDHCIAYDGLVLGHKSVDLLDYYLTTTQRINRIKLEQVFVVPGYAKNGFYHFLLNSLPSLFLYAEIGLKCPIVFPYFDTVRYPEIPSIIKSLFDYLEISEDLYLDADTVKKIEVESVIAPKIFRPSDFVISRYRGYADSLGCSHSLTKVNDIYITRHGRGRRPLVNEIELENTLESLGIKIVSFDKLSFNEQVECISNARLIISPHGAGLANLVFGRSDATVVEINTKPWNICFSNLSVLKGMNYIPINAELASGSSYKDPSAEFNVNIAKVKVAVETVLKDRVKSV